jgi:hypothetical protein
MSNERKIEPDDSFVFSQLMSGFRNALEQLISETGDDLLNRGFSAKPITRALFARLVVSAADIAISCFTAEELAEFASRVVNERLRTYSAGRDD